MTECGTEISDAEDDKGVLHDVMKEAPGYETVAEVFWMKDHMKGW
jgi:hypothetical protein